MTIQRTNISASDGSAQLTNQLQLSRLQLTNQGPLAERNGQYNRFTLAGQYPGAQLALPVLLQACGPATLGPTQLAQLGQVQQVEFTAQVTLLPTAVVLFNGCRFLGPVVMQAGARASFNGCWFVDQANVQNAGLAADAGIVGCISPVAHVNVTTIFSL
jgi:hypothetical protein